MELGSEELREPLTHHDQSRNEAVLAQRREHGQHAAIRRVFGQTHRRSGHAERGQDLVAGLLFRLDVGHLGRVEPERRHLRAGSRDDGFALVELTLELRGELGLDAGDLIVGRVLEFRPHLDQHGRPGLVDELAPAGLGDGFFQVYPLADGRQGGPAVDLGQRRLPWEGDDLVGRELDRSVPAAVWPYLIEVDHLLGVRIVGVDAAIGTVPRPDPMGRDDPQLAGRAETVGHAPKIADAHQLHEHVKFVEQVEGGVYRIGIVDQADERMVRIERFQLFMGLDRRQGFLVIAAAGDDVPAVETELGNLGAHLGGQGSVQPAVDAAERRVRRAAEQAERRLAVLERLAWDMLGADPCHVRHVLGEVACDAMDRDVGPVGEMKRLGDLVAGKPAEIPEPAIRLQRGDDFFTTRGLLLNLAEMR